MAGMMAFDRLFETDRLIFQAFNNGPERKAFVTKLMSADTAAYAQSTNQLLVPPRTDDAERVSGPGSNDVLSVVICLRPEPGSGREPTMVGSLSLDCPPTTRHHRSLNLGILIATEHQGRGYGTEAINWALDWAFAVAGVHAVRLTAFSYNERGIKLYERLGFVKEGIRRESLYFNCQWHNHVMYSMLEKEWAELRGRKIAA
ncbi:acyl-CoA N-acyltransferase [Echria macrotheca]|uniref:Acyl-CoA N-acyltransferase n=1 Tax=Echria macrotheca TaxID=438768 RepID=A0AAJ0FGZ5_9PEZI|nr:acyl-CoA N-acyltransferase [Echria macrotheca]